jgi:tetratricopeptide (TPR) repeat protein
MNQAGKNKNVYFIMAAFSLVIVAVYSPILFNGFVSYDDPLYVYENEVVKAGLTYRGLVWAFTTFHSYNWHPLTWLSHMVDVQLFGLNPAGHHLMNLLFHLANTLLLFGVLRKMTGAVWRSLTVAALFAIHPLHVESVAWVAERKDVLSTFFWLLAIWAYVDYARAGKKHSYLLVMLFLVLGLMAKPMLVTFPFVLLLLDYWPLGRIGPEPSDADGAVVQSQGKTLSYLLLEKVPFLTIALASSAVTYFVQKKGGAVLYASSFSENLGNALISYVKYLAKTVWPHPLAVLYPFDPDEITLWRVAGAALFLALLSFLLLRQAKRRPYIAVGWLWYLVTLVPVIGFVRIGQHAIADRYTYVPLIGLFIIAAWGINDLRVRFQLNRGIIISLATVVFTVLAILTVRQERYWRNGITLFEHAIAVTENNFTAHKNLGLAYGRLGNVEKARSEERISRMLGYQYKIKVFPNDYEAHYNLGIAYSDLGRFSDAIREYQTAIALNPNYAQAYNDLGIALVNEGKIEDAKEAFRSAMRIAPNFTAAAHNYNELEKRQNMR